ncbi:ABC-type transport auxiliary lipoprotein family protein [Pseudomonas lopnurensis]|uniref:ABC-type transport auxiliary lipoprotein family protein n=1 Tax=Pseudomonas lopnurensis TaxID=1477517 RepID=UPI00187907DB|nr:ABC-type transport auxiliary lipoprotein family protein [Pseudomonas lopnurensis]MBE7374311.1 membrane integrity-associated transporter subunit PqiC [Pseudomonas lopnurensis]
MSRRVPIRYLVLPILLGLLSGCTLLPEAEPIRVFLLPTGDVAAASSAPQLDRTLRIHTPQASRVLAGPRIAVVPEGNQISSYQGARWSDAAPTLLRDRLIEAFRQSGQLGAVSSEDGGLQADLALLSDLRAFQSEYVEGTPQVVIRLDAQLASTADQRILASRRFEIRQPSAGTQLENVVSAFGQASDELSRQLLAWTRQAAHSR